MELLPEHKPSRDALLKASGYHSKLNKKDKQAALERAADRWKSLQEKFASPWVPDPIALQKGIEQLPKSDSLLDIVGGDVDEAQRRLAILHAKFASNYP
jgi:hypothetical protein